MVNKTPDDNRRFIISVGVIGFVAMAVGSLLIDPKDAGPCLLVGMGACALGMAFALGIRE